jgi:hypothetical protein
MTVGWRFLDSWKDGSTLYVPLREMKDAYPLKWQSTPWAIQLRMSLLSNGGSHMYRRNGEGLSQRLLKGKRNIGPGPISMESSYQSPSPKP